MEYSSKEELGFISEAIFKQNKVIENGHYLLKRIDIGMSNISNSIDQANKESKTIYVGNAFTGLHLTRKGKPIFIPVSKIKYISGSRIVFDSGGFMRVDQTNEEIMEEIALSC